jgi:hypothetical protein
MRLPTRFVISEINSELEQAKDPVKKEKIKELSKMTESRGRFTITDVTGLQTD